MPKRRNIWRRAPEPVGAAILAIDPHARARVPVSPDVPRWRARVLDPEGEGVTMVTTKDTTGLDRL